MADTKQMRECFVCKESVEGPVIWPVDENDTETDMFAHFSCLNELTDNGMKAKNV